MARRQNIETAIQLMEHYPPALEQMTLSLVGQLELHLAMGLSPAEAMDAIRNDDRIFSMDTLATTPVKSLMWSDLRAMEAVAPGASARAMSALRKRARAEIRSGMWGSQAVEDANVQPYQQALYLSLLDELSEEWQPRNGIERALIEQMAQSQTHFQKWQRRLNTLTNLESRKPGKPDAYEPRVSRVQAIDQAMNMTDRFQRMFLRTQRALRDMRRYTINVEHVGQLNVGEQQVNINSPNQPAPTGTTQKALSSESEVA